MSSVLTVTELQPDDPRFSEGLSITEMRSLLGGKDKGYLVHSGEKYWLSLKHWADIDTSSIRLLLSFAPSIEEVSPEIVRDCAIPSSSDVTIIIETLPRKGEPTNPGRSRLVTDMGDFE